MKNFISENDEYTEADLLDCKKAIKTVETIKKVFIIVAIVSFLATLIFFMISFISNNESLVIEIAIFVSLGIGLFAFKSIFTEKSLLKNLNNAKQKIEIYLENHKEKVEPQEDNSIEEVEVKDDNVIISNESEEQVEHFNPSDGLCVLENQNKESGGNNAINTVFNIFWFIFVGLWGVIINFFTGIAYCLTIIGIPAGITCFKFIPLIFRPAGREVILNYGSHPVLNTLNLIFGGLISYLLCLIYGSLLCVTIVGIPLGRQVFKIGKLFLAPFGSKIVLKDQYTENRDLDYDLEIFIDQLCLEDRNVNLNDGRVVPASEAMKLVLTKEDRKDIISKVEKYETTKNLFDSQEQTTVAFPGILINKSYVEVIVSTLAYGIILDAITIGFICLILYIFTGKLILSPYELAKIISIFALLLILFYLALDILKLIKTERTKEIIKPAYLQKWKNITTYYPTKFTTSARRLRKQAKNPTNRKEYVIANSLAGMIHKILK